MFYVYETFTGEYEYTDEISNTELWKDFVIFTTEVEARVYLSYLKYRENIWKKATWQQKKKATNALILKIAQIVFITKRCALYTVKKASKSIKTGLKRS